MHLLHLAMMSLVRKFWFIAVCLALSVFHVAPLTPSSSHVRSWLPKHNLVFSSSSILSLACKLGGSSIAPTRFSASVSGSDGQEQLSTDRIAEMVEVSFIKACLQLSQGYVDVLKLFVVAVKVAFETDISPSQLADAVAACPVNTAGRQLMQEETLLRTTWIHAVYLILEHINHKGKGSIRDIDDTVRGTYSGILPNLVAMKQAGGNFHVEEIMKKHEAVLPSMIDPMQMAIVSQTIRVLWYTLIVLEEETLAQSPITPQPPIPRGPGTN